MNVTTMTEDAEMQLEQGMTAPPPSPPRWQPETAQPFDPRRKSPRLAAFLSALPGLGQVYVGYYTRGIVVVAVWIMMLMIATNAPMRLEPGPQLAVLFLWLFNVIDAGRLAALYNHAMSGARSVELPDDFKMPAMGGSIVGGALLAVSGALALSNTLLGMRLDWLEQWWPALPLALGLYLIYRGVNDRAAERKRAAAQLRAGRAAAEEAGAGEG